MSYKVSYQDTLSTVEELTLQNRPYFRDVLGMVVSITFGSPSRVFITDFTTNEAAFTDYPYNNFVGDTEGRIQKNKILQIITFPEKLNPLLTDLEKKVGRKSPTERGYALNLTELGVFIRCKLKVKSYNGVLEGIAQKFTIVSKIEFNANTPLYKNVIQNLPLEFIKMNYHNFMRTIPQEYLDNWLNFTPNNSSTTSSAILRTPITPQVRTGFNPSLPSLPSETIGRLIFETPPPAQRSSPYHSETSHNNDEIQVQHERQPAKKKQRITSSHIRRLNTMDQVDGKIFNVRGTLVEIEPLLNQFCIKTDINSPPKLIPITLILKGNLDNGEKELNESNFMRISIIEKSQILRFLGMTEIEEVYIKSNEIHLKFIQILKNRKQVEINVQRRLIKINEIGSLVLGWETDDMTLDKLL